jgi:hypothetical protein
MSWLLYIIVTGTTGTWVGNDGDPIAQAPQGIICEALGEAFAQSLNTNAVLNSRPERYDYRCVEGQPA